MSPLSLNTAPSRRALGVAVALTVASLGMLVGGEAAAARTVTEVPGDVGAMAFSGDGLVVASQPSGRGLSVLRLSAGGPAKVVLRGATAGRDALVSLAASDQALAVGLADSGFKHSRVLIGPAAGPLREVASCSGQGLPGPVSVFGSRVAWGESGCTSAAPGIAIAGADPAVTPLRLAVSGIPGSIVLGQRDVGLVATMRGGAASEIRSFGAGTIGATVATSPYPVAAVGVLGDGTRVGLAGEQGSECGPGRVFTVAPGGGVRRFVELGGPVALGACLGGEVLGGTGDIPRVTADRIVALVVTAAGDERRGETFSIVSARADGSDRRVLARGDDTRALGNIAVDGDRLAWAQPACYRGSEVVVDSLTSPATYRVRHCRAEILTRSARVRDGRIAVRVRCPLGCNGVADAPRFARSTRFAVRRGTSTLHVRVALRSLRGARVKLRLHVANSYGVADTATIAVRR